MVRDKEGAEDKLAVAQQQYLNLIRQFINEHPERFARIACETVLGIIGDGSANPFLRAGKDALLGPDHYLARHYSDLARVLLAKIDDKFLPNLDVEYIRLKDWITTRMSPRHSYGGNYTHAEQERILSTFFTINEDNFGYAILDACDLVYQGIPLYALADGASGTFHQLSFDDDDYVYLGQKGKRSDTHGTARFPDWAEKYFIKKEHLAAHRIFFSGDRPDSEETKVLRVAFRQHIGFASKPKMHSPACQRKHNTKLLELIDEVINRYYGENFELTDRDSWPKQIDVIEWLRSTYSLSERLALAVDLVTRPDTRRT